MPGHPRQVLEASVEVGVQRMPFEQRVVIICVAAFLVLVILELVRKRKLREEYSWLWLLAGLGIAVASLIPFEGLQLIARAMGSEYPTAAMFFLGFVALIFLSLQFSVRLSRMTEQIKNLGQKVALLEASLQDIQGDPPEGQESDSVSS